jgi:hypothetical protein
MLFHHDGSPLVIVAHHFNISSMKKKYLSMQWMLVACFALLVQGMSAQTTCFDFENGIGNWDDYNAVASIVADNTSSNGTNFLRGRDQGGISWLFNDNDFNGMPCGGQICFRFKVINDDVSGQAIEVSPRLCLFMGAVGNMSFRAIYTATSVVVTENSAWVQVCVPIEKVLPTGPPPTGWSMSNGATGAQWNYLMSNVSGIAISTDIDPANSPDEIIGIDDVCVTINPPASCCDLTDNGEFIMQTNCNNGVLTVTVTDPDPDPRYHWWYLMETSVPGQTTDAVTLNGGNPIVPVQNQGGSATFTITDFSKSYYIKHDIWGDIFNGCINAKQVRKAIDLPKADFDFYFTNWLNAWFVSSYCYGEPVRMVALTETPVTAYYIDAWRRPIGSGPNTPFDWYGALGWANGTPPGTIELSQAFAALPTPVYFDPGYEYQIKLAVTNPNLCIGWTEKTHTFTVQCCSGRPDPDFCVDAITRPDGYTLKIKNYNTYNYIGATHEWYVLSSPNENAGPYTKVTSSTSAQPEFDLYTQAQYKLYYTVVHKLKTKCGEICVMKTQFQSGRMAEGLIPGLTGCNATSIDCRWIDSIWNPCLVPTGLFGSCSRKVLLWNPVPNASGYTVEISFNDPACCKSLFPPANMQYNVGGSSLLLWTIATPKYDCFRWRVKTRCANGTTSDWSAWRCYYCSGNAEMVGHDGGNLLAKTATGGQPMASRSLEPTITPNPNNGDMLLSMQAPGDLVLSVEVFNAQGSRISAIARNIYRGGRFNQKLSLGATVAKGLYTIVFTTDYGTFRKKVIVQ